MRKLFAATLAICMFALLVVSVPQVSADSAADEAGVILVSYAEMSFDIPPGYWQGTLTGDVRGTLAVYEQPENFVDGGTEYFFEAFTITTERGVIQGVDEGVYDLATGEFWAHGRVTEGTGHWTFLADYKFFEWGSTSTPFVFPMVGHRVPMILLPPDPVSADEEPTLVSRSDMAYSPEWGCWRGTTAGDVSGALRFYESPDNYFEGPREFFFETFTVSTHRGVIEGFDVGIYDLTTRAFAAYGKITAAPAGWARLVGYTVFEWGTTSSPFEFPIVAEDIPFVLMDL